MDALGDLLAPYSDLIAKIAGGVTCLQLLSGVKLMNDIRIKGGSDAYRPEPLLIGVVLSILSLKFGALIEDAVMINVNIFGTIVSIIFMAIFYFYSSNEKKSNLRQSIGYFAAFTMGCLAYTKFEDPEKIQFRFSMLLTIILIALVGSPLLSLGEIIRNKSTEGMPFPTIFAGTLCAASWALYGLSIKNSTVFYQNLLLLSLSSIQLALFVIYPDKKIAKGKKQK